MVDSSYSTAKIVITQIIFIEITFKEKNVLLFIIHIKNPSTRYII